MTLSSREVSPADIERIREIHKQHGFPFSNPLINVGSSVVVRDTDNLIVGAGYLRPIVEAIMYLDLGQSPRIKIDALKLMLSDANFFADRFGMSEVHLFTESEQFRNILKKHFGFEEPKATALVRKL